ncbi:MAG: hypothetical protein ACTSWQ_09145, partial [Candidatus Thorarchaeota archaeon]
GKMNSQYQGSYETYGDWQKRVFCENSSILAGRLVTPRCTNGKKGYECTVTYDQHGIESDTLMLCAACRKVLRKSAMRHGYKFKSTPIRSLS